MHLSQHHATVEESQRQMRLDKFLAEKLPHLSRARIQSLIVSGHVACGTVPMTNASAKVKLGQSYVLTIPPLEHTPIQAQAIALDILFEDRDILVLNKPAGMVTHPGAGNRDKTLVNALLAHCGDSLSGIGGEKRPGIVHRLDKDTSGILVIAKHDLAHNHLSQQFSSRTANRLYQAFVWGNPNTSQGTIAGQIGRSRSNRQKMAVLRSGGKTAVTNYRVVRKFGLHAAWIECKLETGRTHQIRVHMTHIGHPLIGDCTYGRARRLDISDAGTADYLYHFPRQALHAGLLGFEHPTSGEWLEFQCDLPEDLRNLAEKLSKIS